MRSSQRRERFAEAKADCPPWESPPESLTEEELAAALVDWSRHLSLANAYSRALHTLPNMSLPYEPAVGGGAFRTTHWSIVLAARHQDSLEGREAMQKLCELYWYPVYTYIRRRGHEIHEAQDLTQEFFARLLEKNYLQSVDQQKGRFRSFLLATVQNFLGKQRERAQAIKRGGKVSFISWDDESAEWRYLQEPSRELTPEQLFERRWALSLLENAISKLRGSYAASNKSGEFERLQSYLSGEENEQPYTQLGAKLGISEGAARVSVHRLRRHYGELLRNEIAHTVSKPADIEEELRYIRAVLSR